MSFPEKRRVLYRKNPLRQVICQLRFPPILRIEAEVPAAFQDAIRNLFPDFSEISEWKIELPNGRFGSLLPDASNQLLQPASAKNYSFSSEDEKWRINLTRTFIALSTSDYQRWERFREILGSAIKALSESYSPPYFSRLGLRYIDIISRSELGLDNIDWNLLLQPFILGIIGAPKVGENVREYEGKYEISLDDEKSFVRMITKLTNNAPDNEANFIIDSDFYSAKKTQMDDVMKQLDFFNSRSSRLIQWVITERLHEAMEPEEI